MKIWFIVLLFCFCVPAFSQETRTIPTDELKTRDDLEADASVIQVPCAYQDNNIADNELKARKAAFDALQSRTASVKLVKLCRTTEGTRTPLYLIIDRGKAKLVADSSRDRFGYMRVLTHLCSEIRIGHYFFDKSRGAMVFMPAKNEVEFSPENRFFQCKSDNKESIF